MLPTIDTVGVDEVEWLSDGERANSTTLNRPIKDVAKVLNDTTEIVNALDFTPPCKPTLDLDFANQDFTIYDKQGGFVKRPLADIVSQGRATAGGSTDAISGVTEFAAGENRFTFDGESGEALGYLSEESRTNVNLHSEGTVADGRWAPLNSDFVEITDSTLIEKNSLKFTLTDSSSNDTLVARIVGLAGDSNAIAVRTGYIRVSDPENMIVKIRIAGNTSNSYFSADNRYHSTFSTNDGSTLYNGGRAGALTTEKISTGLFKYTLRTTFTNSTGVAVAGWQISVARAGSSPSTWNAPSGCLNGDWFEFTAFQKEDGVSFPTSYIRTLNAPVTRGVDAMTRTLGQEWNPNEGTFVVDAEYFGTNNVAGGSYVFNDGTVNNRIGVFFDPAEATGGSNDTIRALLSRSGVGSSVASSIVGAGTGFHKVALSFDDASMTLCIDGVYMGTTNHGGLPSVDRLDGQGAGLGRTATRTKHLQYYPRAFDALTLQRLSRIQ